MDHILGGGVPRGRTTLVCGGPGCGKTVLGMEFVGRGAAHGEPGVFISFEQSVEQLQHDFASFDFGLESLVEEGRVELTHIDLGNEPVPETGEYALDALLLQLDAAIASVGAKRITLDTVETLFGPLRDSPTLRAEIRRLFRWLHQREVTSLVTAERGDVEALTRHGLEEYVSDCVVLLDHRVVHELSTRRARIVKYRGSEHSADEHPYLIDSHGLWLFPITSRRLDYGAPEERVSTGIEGLDAMFGGRGYYRGSSVLLSGTAGTGKSSLGGSYVDAACERGESALYMSFEESPDQLLRNMASLGMDLTRWVEAGRLHLRARRPSQLGLEQHLMEVERTLDEVEPDVAVVDPFTNLVTVGTTSTTRAMLTRLVDLLKRREVTTLYTSLGSVDEHTRKEEKRGGISSLMDTWIELLNVRDQGSRKRGIYIIKSRGMQHSGELRELRMTDSGLMIGDPMSLSGSSPPR